MHLHMLIIGPETALVMDRLHFAENGKPPISTQLYFWEGWKEIASRIVGV